MFVASVIQHAKRIRRYCIVIFGLSGTTIFFSIYHPNGMNFERKKVTRTQNLYFDYHYSFWLKRFSF